MKNPELLPFSQIRHKLPDNYVYCWLNDESNGSYDNHSVAFFEGDTTLHKLNLDNPFGLHDDPDLYSDDSDYCLLILVDGSLTVENYIYNEETDGATGLVVLGDLRTKNAVVGGQQIYVTGDLRVDELFWGDYNHGDLVVNGNAKGALFIDTDYSVQIDGEQDFKLRISDRDRGWVELEGSPARDVLVPDVLFEDDGYLGLSRMEMLRFFEAGKSVILDDKIANVNEKPVLPAGISLAEYARTLIKPEEIREILALPITGPFDDYYSEERAGFWAGYHCAFRQEGTRRFLISWPALFRVSWEDIDTKGREIISFFTYEVIHPRRKPEYVKITYNPDQNKLTGWQEEEKMGLERLREALAKFRTSSREIRRLNGDLLAGSPPHDAPAFAIDYWRDAGYLEAAKTRVEKNAEAEAQIDDLPEISEPVEVQGSPFTKIDAKQAREMLRILRYKNYPLWDLRTDTIRADETWLSAVGNVNLEAIDLGKSKTGRIRGMIVMGNLHVAQFIKDHFILAVTGSLHVQAVCLNYGVDHYVGGSLEAGLLYAVSGGRLMIQGDLQCKVVVADSDFNVEVNGNLEADAIVGNRLTVKGVAVEPTHNNLKDLLADDILWTPDDEPSPSLHYDKLFDHIQKKKTIFKIDP